MQEFGQKISNLWMEGGLDLAIGRGTFLLESRKIEGPTNYHCPLQGYRSKPR